MAYNYGTVGNPSIPPGAINPPPPPPTMAPLPMGMMGPPQQGLLGPQQSLMGPQQGMQMGGPMGFISGPMPRQPGPQPNLLNPAMNDAPLEFNVNKNKPPMPIPGDDHRNGRNPEEQNSAGNSNERRDRRSGRGSDRRDRDRERDRERNITITNNNGNNINNNDRERSRDRRDERENTQINAGQQASNPSDSPNGVSLNNMGPPGPGNAASTMPGTANNMWGGMMGPATAMGYPMMGMNMNMMGGGMLGDPNMMSMGQYGMMGGMVGPDGTMMAPEGTPMMPGPDPTGMLSGPGRMQKEIIHCKSCTLFPPNPLAPPPTTRERPPGCRTVFVGGLPDNTTEEIIQEIFERCGEMTTIRLSKKNFCHIRFVFENSVDAAIYLSGYRIRLGSNIDISNTGRLHVDYAQARDDLYEWECRQRALQREQRHRERMEQERMRPPSPPPVVHYTDHEAITVSEKIKAEDSFPKAVQVLFTWLERGDCSKRNANTFYTMIQSTNSHVRRLLGEKSQYEDELQKARELMKGRMQGILIQFGQIERVFTAASHKKVWDHFTKAQRKSIEMWKKQTSEIKTIQLEEVLNERADEEMDVSDNEDEFQAKKRRTDSSEDRASVNTLKEENDSLRCQLEAYKNEVDLVRTDLKAEVEVKDKQLKVLQQTLQGMQQQLMESKRRQSEDDVKLRELEARLKSNSPKVSESCSAEPSSSTVYNSSEGSNGLSTGSSSASKNEASATESESNNHNVKLNDRHARLIGLISTFLHVHPFGAGVDYVWSYLQKLDPALRPSEVEHLMTKFPTVFRQELSGIGANMERKWQFVGFEV